MATNAQIRSALDTITKADHLLLALALFGLILEPDQTVSDMSCAAPCYIHSDMFAYFVISFIGSLFSALMALGLKASICVSRQRDSSPMVRVGYVVSAASSVLGWIGWMLAMINRIQIRLGILGCEGDAGYVAVLGLVIVVFLALQIYIRVLLYAFVH